MRRTRAAKAGLRPLDPLTSIQASCFLCYRPTMKRAFLLFAELCIVAPIAAPQTAAPNPEVRQWPMSAEEGAIRQVSEDWIRFCNSGDAASVAALYTDDGYYLSAHILAHGRQAIEAYWERGIKAGTATS